MRICSAEVDKFFVRLVNANSAEANAVLAAHTLAKAAAQFYRGLELRINEEMTQFRGAFMTTDKPEADVTEGLLDLGEFGNIDHLPNFLPSGGGAILMSEETIVAETPLTEPNVPVEAPVVELPELRYEYQPTDDNGMNMGGKQVLKYKTTEELIQKLQEQNVLLQRKWREETCKNRLGNYR